MTLHWLTGFELLHVYVFRNVSVLTAGCFVPLCNAGPKCITLTLDQCDRSQWSHVLRSWTGQVWILQLWQTEGTDWMVRLSQILTAIREERVDWLTSQPHPLNPIVYIITKYLKSSLYKLQNRVCKHFNISWPGGMLHAFYMCSSGHMLTTVSIAADSCFSVATGDDCSKNLQLKTEM